MKTITLNTLNLNSDNYAIAIKKLLQYPKRQRRAILEYISKNYYYTCELLKGATLNKKGVVKLKGKELKEYQEYRMLLFNHLKTMDEYNIIKIEIKDKTRYISFNNDIETWKDIKETNQEQTAN